MNASTTRPAITGLAAALAALLAAACTPTAKAPPSVAAAGSASGVTAPGFSLPEGGGCAGEIARYRAVIANDLATGHVNRGVHDRIGAELDRAAGACSAGRDAEAVRQVRATKSRFGYS